MGASALPQVWDVEKAEELYLSKNWGKGYFGVNAKGNLTVHPDRRPDRSLDLKELIVKLRDQGVHTPVLLRFPEILQHRIGEIANAFRRAIQDSSYGGRYQCIFPIKVNQQRQVVEEVYRCGLQYKFGLEAGSKPELLCVLALVEDNETPIICNGFKDASYLEAVVLARKMGKTIIPVIEKFSELELLVQQATLFGVKPLIGVRAKLATRGSGRWESSAGAGAKFGLTASELIDAVAFLEQRGMAQQLKLLHFHIGSQVTNIRRLKEAINEAGRIYVELARAGAGMEYLDVGGGLGVDYDGSQTNFESSMNYSLDEYARDVVYGIQTVCDLAEIAHPTIMSESGRAITAHHSLTVFNVLGVSSASQSPVPPRPEGTMPQPLEQLFETLHDLTAKNVLEMYHDAVKQYDDALNLFKLGYLSLKERSIAEKLFWSIMREVHRTTERLSYVPDDLKNLEVMLADTYFCNFSLFQSILDSWAIGQLFPVMPIHRLNERPDRRATLADITCDSDGKIDKFIDLRDVKKVLELHKPNGSDYFLGVFLTGAYQETLGDNHNLFGDAHAVDVRLGSGEGDGAPSLEISRGDTIKQALIAVEYDTNELFDRLHRQSLAAVAAGRFDAEDAADLVDFFRRSLAGYTYLE
ncbi:MAG: biosynthetic arginine decarboxylase [Planctomycetia bacterium]